MNTDGRHRYGCDNRRAIPYHVAAREFDFSDYRRGTIVLDGMSANQAGGGWHGQLVRQVPRGLRHIGCMWLPDGDEAMRCNQVAKWTMGECTRMPRVYCDTHGHALARYLEERRKVERDFIARKAAGLVNPKHVIPADERAQIVIELKAGSPPRIWAIAHRHGCHVSTVSRIAVEAGIDNKTRALAIRADIRAGRLTITQIATKYGVCKKTIHYHAQVCGVRSVGPAMAIDTSCKIEDDDVETESPAGVAAPPGRDATTEGS